MFSILGAFYCRQRAKWYATQSLMGRTGPDDTNLFPKRRSENFNTNNFQGRKSSGKVTWFYRISSDGFFVETVGSGPASICFDKHRKKFLITGLSILQPGFEFRCDSYKVCVISAYLLMGAGVACMQMDRQVCCGVRAGVELSYSYLIPTLPCNFRPCTARTGMLMSSTFALPSLSQILLNISK